MKIAAAASPLAAGGACIFMVDAVHAEDEGRAEGGRERGPYAGRGLSREAAQLSQLLLGAGGFVASLNKTPESRPACHITKYEKDGEALFVSTSCMHCEEPACASVCAAGAIKKAEDGVVYVDKDRCIGCKYCYQACPFGVPTYSSAAMDKCDCCTLGGTRSGNAPRCAEACKFGALHFGTVDELLAQCPDAKVVEASTKLSFYLAQPDR